MARDPDTPPDSPLSSMSSSEPFEEDHDTMEEDSQPPPKRQKVGDGSGASSALVIPEPDPLEDLSDVSSDTSGEIPTSPVGTRPDEDDFQEQVSVCAWDGCKAGDQGNMDRLVKHIHNEHIEGHQKKYTCEWNGCSRKSMPHASGYALKAHMRSHTREKPFYCYLPECDRAFTRSDALAKHMRTVHETEALRPSDPVPKSHQAGPVGGKSSKFKIIIKTPQSHAAGQDDAVDDGSKSDDGTDWMTVLTEEQGFTPAELGMDLKKLLALCQRQVKWAKDDGDEMREMIKKLEEVVKKEWLEKEVLLEQVFQSEINWHERRQAVLAGTADVKVTDALVAGGSGTTEHTAAEAEAAKDEAQE